jgi:hypothetical protein
MLFTLAAMVQAIGYWLLAMRFAVLLFAFALMRSLIPGKNYVGKNRLPGNVGVEKARSAGRIIAWAVRPRETSP